MYAWISILVGIVSALGALLICVFPFNFADKGFFYDIGAIRQPSFYELVFNIQKENLIFHEYSYEVLSYFIFEILFLIFSFITIVIVQKIDRKGRTNKSNAFFIVFIFLSLSSKIAAITFLGLAYKSFNLKISEIIGGIIFYSIFELISLVSTIITIYLIYKENKYHTNAYLMHVRRRTVDTLNEVLDKYQDDINEEFNDTFKDAK